MPSADKAKLSQICFSNYGRGIKQGFQNVRQGFVLADDLPFSAGKTLAENLENVPDLKEGQMLIYPIDHPIKSSGHIQIMYGNLAPDGCVGKITGKEGLEFQGPARVFDSEELMLRAVEAGPQKLKVWTQTCWHYNAPNFIKFVQPAGYCQHQF